jgi:thiopeptide-type bacteriocin biosynthesis protein
MTKHIDTRWIYLKIYLGEVVDRMDWMIQEAANLVARRTDIEKWFFLRYLDEDGIHIRLRVLPMTPDAVKTIRIDLIDAIANRLSRINAQPPGDYAPMVAPPGFEAQIGKVTIAHNDVRVGEAAYEPEFDKFGGAPGMPIAETLFWHSSRIAAQILRLDTDSALSRKSLVPRLMHETFAAFAPATDAATFWREYSYYWLGARTPAAEDWRERFLEKSGDLRDSGVSALHPHGPDHTAFEAIIADWSTALHEAAAAYRHIAGSTDADVKDEVLIFTFAHLMNNRLGIASLEEAYMGALLERECAPKAVAA